MRGLVPRPPETRSHLNWALRPEVIVAQPTLGLVQELAAWRELAARQLNVPLRRIAIDPVLVALAQRPPNSIRQLGQVRGLSPHQVAKFGKEIIDALNRGRNNAPPVIEPVDSFPAELEATVDFLSACMRALAQEQSISTAILANRSDLRELVTCGEAANIPLLRGWRRELVGNALLGALEGEAVAVVTGTKHVHFEWRQTKTRLSQ